MTIPPLEAGTKFGRLTVLGVRPCRSRDHKRIYLCQCECGNTAEVVSSRLSGGKTQSCGCLRNEAALRGVAAARLVNLKHVRCTVPGCDEPHLGLGLCRLHWERQHEQGTVDDPWTLCDDCGERRCRRPRTVCHLCRRKMGRINSLPSHVQQQPSYPWHAWLDGSLWELIPGQDFHCASLTMRKLILRKADAEVHISRGRVYVRAIRVTSPALLRTYPELRQG